MKQLKTEGFHLHDLQPLFSVHRSCTCMDFHRNHTRFILEHVLHRLPCTNLHHRYVVCTMPWIHVTTSTVREDVESPVGWEWESQDVQGYPVRWLKQEWNPKKPLAIFIHGWNSRASNMLGRSALFQESGYNCVLFEMRDNGGNKRVPHWAAMHVCHDLENVLVHFEQRGWLKNGFLIHGHSLGGFVAQRALRPELESSKHAQGVILESPVTSYEYINNQTCDYLKIPKSFQRPMMHRLLRYYNRLNPSQYQVPSIDFLRPPEWGLPQCPQFSFKRSMMQHLGSSMPNS